MFGLHAESFMVQFFQGTGSVLCSYWTKDHSHVEHALLTFSKPLDESAFTWVSYVTPFMDHEGIEH